VACALFATVDVAGLYGIASYWMSQRRGAMYSPPEGDVAARAPQ
jgi:hypothetical protein